MLSGKFECVRPVSCAKTKRVGSHSAIHRKRNLFYVFRCQWLIQGGEGGRFSKFKKYIELVSPLGIVAPFFEKSWNRPWSKMLFVLS